MGGQPSRLRFRLAQLPGKLQFQQLQLDRKVEAVPNVSVIQALPRLSNAMPLPLWPPVGGGYSTHMPTEFSQSS